MEGCGSWWLRCGWGAHKGRPYGVGVLPNPIPPAPPPVGAPTGLGFGRWARRRGNDKGYLGS